MLLAPACCPCLLPAAVNEPGPGDLVVIAAEENATLYRLTGRAPVPWGQARFHNPLGVVASSRQSCFYVLDQPARMQDPHLLWRIAADGAARIVAELRRDGPVPPFNWLHSMTLDDQDRVLVVDGQSGVWRVEPDGRVQQLVRSDPPVLRKLTAAASLPGGALLVAVGYQDEIVGERGVSINVPGDPVQRPRPMLSTLRTQGGLFRMTPAAAPQLLLENRKPGGQYFDTYWRDLRQMFVDAAGRLLLVDRGSKRTTPVRTPQPGRPKDHTLMRSDILGGIAILRPDGRLDDLTFRTPQGNSGAMRHPRAIAQWSDDTYIVADPEMVAEGVNGTGGLLLLRLDGSREARWAFGYRIRPCGVAILRGAGAPIAPQSLTMDLGVLAGTWRAGPIERIRKATYREKPQPPPPSRVTGVPALNLAFVERPMAQAVERLRGLFENARWHIAPDGALRLSGPPGANWSIAGRVAVNRDFATASAANQRQNAFDLRLFSVDAMVTSPARGQLRLSVTANVLDSRTQLNGEFDQLLTTER